MAQTVQRAGPSGSSKRKAPEADSDPPTPAPKKAKTGTARKSTGGRPPRPSTAGPAPAAAAGQQGTQTPYSTTRLRARLTADTPRRRRTPEEAPSLPPGDSSLARNKEIPEEHRSTYKPAAVLSCCASPPPLLLCGKRGREVREIAMDMITDENDYSASGLRWQSSAILALQEATEAFLVHLFEDACAAS
ncbi:hypothetical protein C0992_000816 [Termitomyces sp. T32_za158]|nr:hypothetical protein C0992_000816 [Termitomyces sp. T32_za158]